jgi:hypothetical protein
MARNTPTPPTESFEDTAELGMDEAGIGAGASGLYFSKAPRIEAWHAFTQEHDPIGMVSQDKATSHWKVKVGREVKTHNFSSSTAARAYLVGWYDRDLEAQAVTTATNAPGQPVAPAKPEGGYDATASTVVTA